MARRALPARRRPRRRAVPRSTTSRPTRSAPPRPAATRSGASVDVAPATSHHRAVPTLAIPDPAGRARRRRPAPASRRSRRGSSSPTRSCRPTRSARVDRRRRRRPAGDAARPSRPSQRELERRLARRPPDRRRRDQRRRRHGGVAAARAPGDAGVPAVAIVARPPAGPVLRPQRGAVASASSTPAVVDRHLAAVRAAVDGGALEREGFAPVVVLRSRRGDAGRGRRCRARPVGRRAEGDDLGLSSTRRR